MRSLPRYWHLQRRLSRVELPFVSTGKGYPGSMEHTIRCVRRMWRQRHSTPLSNIVAPGKQDRLTLGGN